MDQLDQRARKATWAARLLSRMGAACAAVLLCAGASGATTARAAMPPTGDERVRVLDVNRLAVRAFEHTARLVVLE